MKPKAKMNAPRSAPERRPSHKSASQLPAGMQSWLAIMLLIVAPLAVFWPICTHDFLNFDDVDQVRDNPTMNPVAGHSLVMWWTTPGMDMYMPVTYSIWGAIALQAYQPADGTMPAHLDPAAFHAANLIVHVLCGLAVFALLRALFGGVWPAAIGALLFDLHPVQVEAVAWMSQLKTVLSALLALVAIWQYVLAVRGKSNWHYAAALALFALAILAKPAAIVAPAVAGVLDVLIIGRSWRSAVKWLWPWGVLAIAGGLETMIFQSSKGATWNVAWYLRPLLAMDSVAFYLGKLFWPRHLTVDYGLRPDVMVRQHWLILKCAAVVGICGAAALGCTAAKCGFRKSTAGGDYAANCAARQAIAAGILVFLAPLLPVLGFVTFEFQWYSNVTDHYLYLSMLGPALVATWVCQRWNNWPVYVGAGAALVLLGWASNLQTAVWKNTTTLFADNLVIDPASALAINQFARLSLDENDYQSTLAYARKETGLHPDDTYAWRVSGLCLWQKGDRAEAMAAYRRALALDPDDPLTLEDFAGAMMESGRLADAEQLNRHAVGLDPGSAVAHYDLALVLKKEGKLLEANEQYRIAMQLKAQHGG